MQLSLCMIVRDEQHNLARCLRQVTGVFDELVIVDTGSVDRTKEIAAEFTEKIYDFTWIDDFSAARNFSFSKATKEYILWLDADDIITEESREGLKTLKNTLPGRYKGVYMPYWHMEDGAVINSFPRLRMVRADAGYRWRDRIHETLFSDGVRPDELLTSEVAIRQNVKPRGTATRYLRILENIVNSEDPDLRARFLYASELEKHGQAEEAIRQFETYYALGGIRESDNLFACMQLGTLYEQTGAPEKALKLYAGCMPSCGDRAEFCCQLGSFYLQTAKDEEEAVFWYRAALACPRPENTMVLERFYHYVPHFWLWQISQRRGDKALAEQHLLSATAEMKRLEAGGR